MKTMADPLKKALHIEPTSKCNLSCTMCFRKTWLDEPFADMRSRAVFERTRDTMPDTVETVFFGGMGEPLFHRDILDDGEARRFDPRDCQGTELLTNGTLLTSRDVLERSWTPGSKAPVGVRSTPSKPIDYENIRQNSNFALVKG